MNKLSSNISKNSIDEIRVELSEFKGHDLASITDRSLTASPEG